MASTGFFRSLVELAACESINALLEETVKLVERELDVRGYVEVWANDKVCAGDVYAGNAAHSEWIGLRYTIGVIHLDRTPGDIAAIRLLAQQLAPLAERLVDQERSLERSLHEEIECVYERRIREELIRCDGNASEVARRLSVSRNRVASVARRWTRGGHDGR